MLGYATIGTNDIDRALEFYDALLAEVGGKRWYTSDRITFYSSQPGAAMIAVCKPYDGEAQHQGNGNMLAIPGGSHEGVDKLYAKARELGATDEGEPGERIPDVFYGAYVRDLDGNKLCFFDMKTP